VTNNELVGLDLWSQIANEPHSVTIDGRRQFRRMAILGGKKAKKLNYKNKTN
jgi:hypothetical protein